MNLIPKAYAVIENPAVPAYGQGNGNQTLGLFIANLWRTIIVLGALALIVFLVWGGLSWVIAGGDKQKIEAAQARITQGIIGMAVLAGSVAIMYFLRTVFQIDLLNPQFIAP